MLIDKKGGTIDPNKLPKGRAKREAALAELREVPVPHKRHGTLFTLEQRAVLREVKR